MNNPNTLQRADPGAAFAFAIKETLEAISILELAFEEGVDDMEYAASWRPGASRSELTSEAERIKADFSRAMREAHDIALYANGLTLDTASK